MSRRERALRAIHWQAGLRAAEQDADFLQAFARRRAADEALHEAAKRRLALHGELTRQQALGVMNPALMMSMHALFRAATECERLARDEYGAAVHAEAHRASERAKSHRRAERIEQAAEAVAKARAQARSAHEERALDDLWLSRLARTAA